MPRIAVLLVCALAAGVSRAAELSLSAFEATGQWTGVELSSEQVRQGDWSGKWWHMDQNPTACLAACPRDWSGLAGVRLALFSPTRAPGVVVLHVASENSKTPGADGYAWRIDLRTWEGWLDLTMPFTGMDLIGAPRGWDQVDGLRLEAADWGGKPNPAAVLYLDDLRLLGQAEMRGPRLSDEEFFGALDLAWPGLERVAAAVDAADYPRAKAELLAYYRSREGPRWHFDWRQGPRDQKPTVAALTSWNGFSRSLTVDWTGWKRFRLRKRDFRTVHEPLGWGFIRYVAFTPDDPGRGADLYLDDLRLTGPEGTVDIGSFEAGLEGWEGLELSDERAHSGRRSGRWSGPGGAGVVRNANLVHDWSGYDDLEFWLYSPAAGGARISVVLDSEDLEFPETAQDVLDHRWLRVHGSLYDMGADLDWSLLPFEGDDPDRTREWTWCGLNRMHQWIVLVRAYWVTADERYPREVISQLLDWTADCPFPSLTPAISRRLGGPSRAAFGWPTPGPIPSTASSPRPASRPKPAAPSSRAWSSTRDTCTADGRAGTD